MLREKIQLLVWNFDAEPYHYPQKVLGFFECK